ncbi:hypothetical protein GCM10022230_06790 [Pseudoclavibacter caeni]
MTTATPDRSRAENVLGAMAVAVVGLSAVCALVTVVTALTGVPFTGVLARIVQTIPLFGLPAGMLLVIAFTLAVIRRRRATQTGDAGPRS